MKIYIGLLLIFGLNAHASDWSGVEYLDRNFIEHLGAIPVSGPVYHEIYNQVSQSNLQLVLKQMTGVIPVTVGGVSYSITDRFAPSSKAKYRGFWMQYFKALGLQVQEIPYTTRHSIGEAQGHNLEAILPGKSKDTVVIIVHYDSIGPDGREASNPGVDDDMSGMAVSLETARILAQYKDRLHYTVRFVAADYEEHPYPGLEGARQYAAYLKNLATAGGFKIVAAVDNEQIGWNCAKDGQCDDGSQGDSFDVFSCSGDGNRFDFPAMGQALGATAAEFSKLKLVSGCMGENSDHYAMWEIGVPAVVYSEHNPFNNPHFDGEGGDTYDKIDQDYFYNIARVGVTFAAQLVGID